eukprot:2030967-Pleurochrysis_carterae.AAC.1
MSDTAAQKPMQTLLKQLLLPEHFMIGQVTPDDNLPYCQIAYERLHRKLGCMNENGSRVVRVSKG